MTPEPARDHEHLAYFIVGFVVGWVTLLGVLVLLHDQVVGIPG